MEELSAHTPEGPHYFPDDTLTDQPERVIAGEVIREKILRNMRDEIPHGTAVSIEKMREREEGGILDIEANIYCEKDSHKGMIIGKGGSMLKKIASEARADLEEFLDVKMLGQGAGRLAQQRKHHPLSGPEIRRIRLGETGNTWKKPYLANFFHLYFPSNRRK